MAVAGDDIRAKKRDETDLQWQVRIAQLDTDQRDKEGPLITREAQQHAEYEDEFVLHVETQTLARTKRNVTASPFMVMHMRGSISAEQYGAAMEIADTVERLGRGVSVRSASLEARVDNSAGNRDMLIERLSDVQLEATYNAWHRTLPMPRRMIVEMILTSGSLFAKSRSYRMGWPKARKRLLRALDRWVQIREQVVREIDEEDVERYHARIGGGKVVW